MEYTLSNTNITEKELREEFSYRVKNNIDLDMEYLLTHLNTCLLLALENKHKQTIGIISDTRFRLLKTNNNFLEFENNHLDEFNKIITHFFKNTNRIEDKSKAGNIVIELLSLQEDVNTEILKNIENFQERMDKYIENSNRFNNLVDEDLFQHIDTRKLSYSLREINMRKYFELAIIVYKKNKDFVVSAFKKAINIMELYEYYFNFREVNVKTSEIINLNDAFMESFNRDEISLKEPTFSFIKNYNTLMAIVNLSYKGIRPKIVIENKTISSDLYFDFILFHKAGIITDINLQEITKKAIEYNTRKKIVSLQSFMEGAYKIANHGYLREHRNNEVEISEINLMRNEILKNTIFDHEDILGKKHAFYTTILDTFLENITEEEKNDYIKSLKQKEYIALYEECKLKIQLQNF